MATELHKNFIASSIGLDAVYNKITNMFSSDSGNDLGAFPAYNIKKTSDIVYIIQMELAGFKKADVIIKVEHQLLSISGTLNTGDEKDYTHKGIHDKSFTRHFQLADSIEIKSAIMADGVLAITCVNNIPDKSKGHTVEVT